MIPRSTTYALVLGGKIVAKGSAREIRRLRKQRGYGFVAMTSKPVGHQYGDPTPITGIPAEGGNR